MDGTQKKKRTLEHQSVTWTTITYIIYTATIYQFVLDQLCESFGEK